MTHSKTFEYIRKHTPQELCDTNSKKTLHDMYVELYGIEPRASARKLDLAYDCWNFVSNQIRTEDLTKNLR